MGEWKIIIHQEKRQKSFLVNTEPKSIMIKGVDNQEITRTKFGEIQDLIYKECMVRSNGLAYIRLKILNKSNPAKIDYLGFITE